MKSAIALIALGCIGLAAAFASSAGAASSGLQIIGATSSSGQIAATTMSARKSKASALYIRGYGRGLSGFAVVACSRPRSSVATKLKVYSSMQTGKLYSVPLPFAGDCEVTASLRGSGRIQLQILG